MPSGSVSVDLASLPGEEKVYSESTSLLFKHTHVFRIVDKKRNTLVYVAISDRVIEGSPQNSITHCSGATLARPLRPRAS